MIASLRGTVLSCGPGRLVLEAAGVGYEVSVTSAASAALRPGEAAFLLVVESFGMYGGGSTLYGFATPADRDLFLAFRDSVPDTGAKKALEYLDKASKSLPDFRRAVLDRDARLLCAVFGFTKKTAAKLVESLRERLESVAVPGPERLARAGDRPEAAMAQALSALSALGYKPAEARAALQAVAEEDPGSTLDAEGIVRLALKRL